MSSEVAKPQNGLGKAKLASLFFLNHVWTIVEMEARKLRKDPLELILRGVQPALWLLVFGQAFSRFRVFPNAHVSYKGFLAPGILAQSITFISIFYGIAIIWERDMGLLQKIATTPIHRSAIVVGKMLSASLRSLGQAVMILALALLLGIRMNFNVGSMLGVLVTVILGGAFFSGLSMVIATIVRTRERMMGIGQLITMPLFFSSNALYPMSIMPAWLKVLSTMNPMSYLVDGLRQLLLSIGDTALWLDWSVLAGAALIMLLLNTKLYSRILSS